MPSGVVRGLFYIQIETVDWHMEAIPGGVKDMRAQDVNTIVDLKVQLARIEEALKPLAAWLQA
ncbi:hypothetical protein MKY85_20665 [Paenibacillus sp. FSL R5-0749]|uniref:hypothetical protein n=1 Tax=Paenibacillus sp. FSL R5-0749 TaxID=2921657 RepID=UPI00315A825D